MSKKKIFLNTFVLILLANCASTEVPNTEVCAVAGVLSAGMDCAETLTAKTRSMDLHQAITFLEPQEEITNPDGTVTPARGAALCQSSEDWGEMKTALEQACKILGPRCTYEMHQAIAAASSVIDRLLYQVMEKRKDQESRHQLPGS